MLKELCYIIIIILDNLSVKEEVPILITKCPLFCGCTEVNWAIPGNKDTPPWKSEFCNHKDRLLKTSLKMSFDPQEV